MVMKLDINSSIYKIYLQQASSYPNNNSLYFMGKYFSYRHVLKRINQVAYSLKKIGVTKDSVVTICLPNIPEAIYSLYGVNQLGCKANLVHPLMKKDMLYENMKKVNSKVLICLDINYLNFKDFESDGIQIILAQPTDELNFIKKLAYKYVNRDKLKKSNKTILFSSFYKNPSLNDYDNDCEEDRFYLHSGGTTGEPKTIALSNMELNAICVDNYYLMDTDNLSNKHMLAVLPIFHGFGLVMGIHIVQYSGACSTLMPKFSSSQACKYLKKGKINCIIGIPILYEALLKNPKFKSDKLKNLIVCFVGGDNVTDDLLDRFNLCLQQVGAKARLYQGYGLTEFVSVTNVNTSKANKRGSVGKPLTGLKEKIIDSSTLEDLGTNKEGEICISGLTMMNGYRFPDNSDCYIYSKDGTKWIRTGDYGYIDEDGFLFFKQRLKRIVIVSGVNVFPSEVENVVSNIDGVFLSCAIGKANIKHGHILDLYIVKDRNYKGEISISNIKETIKNKCGVYAMPDKVIFVKKLPKTLIGKVDANKLEQLIKDNKVDNLNS